MSRMATSNPKGASSSPAERCSAKWYREDKRWCQEEEGWGASRYCLRASHMPVTILTMPRKRIAVGWSANQRVSLRRASGPKTHRKMRWRGAMRSNTPFPTTKAAKIPSSFRPHSVRSSYPPLLLSPSPESTRFPLLRTAYRETLGFLGLTVAESNNLKHRATQDVRIRPRQGVSFCVWLECVEEGTRLTRR